MQFTIAPELTLQNKLCIYIYINNYNIYNTHILVDYWRINTEHIVMSTWHTHTQ